jgi:hypothetical protein
VRYPIDFYTLGHFSKFVLPGARRVYSSNAAGVLSAAFLNPEGSKALVAFNDTAASVAFQVTWGKRSLAYTLPGFSGVTFTWTGTQDGGYPVAPGRTIQASSFHRVAGLQTETTSDTLGGFNLGYAENNDYAVYRNVNFGGGATGVTVRVASFGGGNLEFRLGSPTGTRVGVVPLPDTGGWQSWRTITAPVSGAAGLHDLVMVFKGGSGIGNVNWFRFDGSAGQGPVAQLVWSTQPGLATNGLPFARQPVLITADAAGAPTTEGLPARLDVAVALTAGDGPLLGTTNVNIGTDGLQGVVHFTDLQVNAEGEGMELTATGASITGAPSANLLLNPDFNAPNSGAAPAYWSTWVDAGGGWANHENKTEVTYDGSYYMVVGGFENQGGGCHQTVPASAGMTYELSVLSGADSWWLPYGEMRMSFLDAVGDQVGYRARPTLNPPDYGSAPDVPHPWAPYTLTAVAPSGTEQVKVEFMSTGTGSIWYENASLTQALIPPQVDAAVTLPFTVAPARPPSAATNGVVGVTHSGDGTFTFRFVGTVGARYYLETVPALLTPVSWTPVPGSTSTVTDLSGIWDLVVTNDGPHRFYRPSPAGSEP